MLYICIASHADLFLDYFEWILFMLNFLQLTDLQILEYTLENYDKFQVGAPDVEFIEHWMAEIREHECVIERSVSAYAILTIPKVKTGIFARSFAVELQFILSTHKAAGSQLIESIIEKYAKNQLIQLVCSDEGDTPWRKKYFERFGFSVVAQNEFNHFIMILDGKNRIKA
jgi:L-amino acid N-acyltransferase YncA